MKRQQLEDGRLTGHIHKPSPRGHRPSCPLPVANGRAQPKDRSGSKKHKKSRSADGQQKATPPAQPTRLEKHTSCSTSSQSPASGWGERNASNRSWTTCERRHLWEARGSTAEGRRQPVGLGRWDWGSFPSPAPWTTDPHQYLRPNTISRAGRTQEEAWDFFDCFLLRNVWKQISGGRNIVFYVFIVYILMLLSKGTEARMNFRFEARDVKSLGYRPALHPKSSHHASLQPICSSFILLMGWFKCRAQEEEEGDGRKTQEVELNGVELKLYQRGRETDVGRTASEAGPLISWRWHSRTTSCSIGMSEAGREFGNSQLRIVHL